MPNLVRQVTTPAQRFLLKNEEEGDGLTLNNDQAIRVNSKAEKSFEVLILLIDKIVFGIFFVIVISLHI